MLRFRLSEVLELFEGNNEIDIYGYGKAPLFYDTKEKILKDVDYQTMFAKHFVKSVSLSTDWRIRPIFKIYID